MATKKTEKTYYCGNGKTSQLKIVEGVNVKCKLNGNIASAGTKCEITCDAGVPDFPKVECTNAGWRKSNKIVCEGVHSGVIVGAVIGLFAVVILIALVYAKYLQKKKKLTGKVQTGKAAPALRRPGRTTASSPPKENTSLNPNIHGKNGSRKSSNQDIQTKSKPPSYSEVDINGTGKSLFKTRNSAVEVSSRDRKSRRNNLKPQYSNPSQGYAVGYPGHQYTESQFSNFGYQNQGYYQGQAGYTFPSHEPQVGYMAHPQVYPPAREYQRPYHVST